MNMDQVQVPTYNVGESIDWLLKHPKDARWDIVGLAMQVMVDQFTPKPTTPHMEYMKQYMCNEGLCTTVADTWTFSNV